MLENIRAIFNQVYVYCILECPRENQLGDGAKS